tara:strand:+ start:4567 stop:5814 length:1248 start_codon:yes stop_codon:yes gene_type:complete
MDRVKLPDHYIVLDIESTGLDVANDRIVELGLLEVRRGRVLREWSFLLNPQRDINPMAQRVHGLSNARVASCPKFAERAEEILKWVTPPPPVVAYNGDRFDRPMLEAEFARCGITMPQTAWVDLLPIARKALPLKRFRLVDVAAHFDISVDGAHRAAKDTRILMNVLEGMRGMVASEPQPELPSAVAPTGIVSRALQDLAPLAAESRRWANAALELVCSTDEDHDRCVKAVIALKDASKRLEKLRKTHTAPLHEKKKEIDTAFREGALAPIKEALAHIEQVQQPYLHKKHLERKEALLAAEEAAAAVADAEGAKQRDKGLSEQASNAYADAVYNEEVERRNRKAMESATTQTDLGLAKVKVKYRVEVIDEAQVPAEYLMVDVAKIAELAERLDGDVTIAGVTIEPIYTQHTRRAR